MSALMSPELADLQAVVEQVWSSYLGDEEPLLPRLVAPGTPFDQDDVWSAAVSVSGGWAGTITVELAAPVAVHLTREMLAMPEGDEPLEDADVADAVGELVNMIGGNIKSLMPGPSALTLPVVAAGRAAHPHESVEVTRLDAVWQGRPVRVSVRAVPSP